MAALMVETAGHLVGQRLRALRKQRGVTQEELADATGMSRGSIANIELGDQTIQLDKLIAAARYLGTTAGAILDGDEVPALPRIITTTVTKVRCETCGVLGDDLTVHEAAMVRRIHIRSHLPAVEPVPDTKETTTDAP